MDSPIVQIQKYLHALYSRRYLFLIVAATTAVVIVTGSFFVTKKYEAKSTVFIEKNVINNLMKGLTVSPSMGDRIRVLRYHMLSRDMIQRVLKKMDMDVRAGDEAAFGGLIKYCQEKTSINLKGDDLFFVSITDPRPQFARDFINTLVTTYVEENLAEKREESFGANRFLTEQVNFYKAKLDEIEDKIYVFRKKTGIFSTVSEASIMDEIKAYEEELKTIKIKKNEMLATVKTIREQLKSMEQRTSFGSSSSPSAVSGGETRISDLQNRLNELLLVYNEQYPTVVKLREQISELQKRKDDPLSTAQSQVPENFNPLEDPIYVDLKMRLNATQSDLKALEAREQDLTTQIAENKRILQNFPQDKKLLADMERDRAMTKNVYETLLERVGISEVSKQMEVADKATTFRIVDPAILPTAPVGTKRIVLMVMGLLAGIGAGVGAVVLREKLDDRVKDTDSLRALGVAVLAEIPLMFNEVEERVQRRKDKLVYSYAGVCLFFVVAMMGHDLLGLKVVDQLILRFRLDALVSSLLALVR